MKNNNKKSAMLGLALDNVNEEEVIEQIFQKADKVKASNSLCSIVVTVNVDFLVNTFYSLRFAPKNPLLLKIMQNADLIFADGMPLVWLSKILGSPLKERVAGSTIFEKMVKRAAAENKRIFFLGGTAEQTNKTAQIFLAKYPNLQIAGVETPMVLMDDSEQAKKQHQEICQQITDSKTDLLFIGLGNPKQEFFAYKNRELLRGVVSIGIGGSFNFITGKVKRAPVWMQKACMEWIYRIIQEPKRLIGRYSKGLFVFGNLSLQTLLATPLKLFRNKRSAECEFVLNENFELDVAGIKYFNNSERISLLAVMNQATEANRTLKLINCSKILKLQLKLMRFWSN